MQGAKVQPAGPWPDSTRRQGSWPTVGASPIPFGKLPAPTELSMDEIAAIVKSFADSAQRAAAAGFQVLELHGAHGYLIHQFLSPHSNARTDQYGGSLENRMRFALEVVKAVRRQWPDELPLFFRVSAPDWLSGDTDDPRPGWTVNDTIELSHRLKTLGVDLMDVSTGGSAPGRKDSGCARLSSSLRRTCPQRSRHSDGRRRNDHGTGPSRRHHRRRAS